MHKGAKKQCLKKRLNVSRSKGDGGKNGEIVEGEKPYWNETRGEVDRNGNTPKKSTRRWKRKGKEKSGETRTSILLMKVEERKTYLWDSKTLPSGSCQPSFIEASFSFLRLLLTRSAFPAPPSKYSKSITLLQLQLLLFNTHLCRDICTYLLINRKLINTCYGL